MSVKFGVLIVAGSLAVAGSSIAASATTSAGKTAGEVCAAAAASAEIQGSAADSQIAACTLAIRIASGGEAETQILAQLRSSNAVVMPTEAWARIAAAYINRGVLHVMRSEFDKARADSDVALELDNDLPEAAINRGAALLQQHRPAEAAADFTHALKLTPAHQERVYFDRAMAREDMGDIKGAYADYQQALLLNPQWDKPRLELMRFKVVPAEPIS
jgi:tetratricopeptide (TPR) repeat protein